MQPFDGYFEKKMKDAGFKALFEKECHVCTKTVAIFGKVDRDRIDLSDLAREVKTDTAALKALRDADYCDPKLVIRLCQHLGLPLPEGCPRLDGMNLSP